ncbi:MAG: DUF6782 family putative metallopeptidase [Pseudomonadota bacterium]
MFDDGTEKDTDKFYNYDYCTSSDFVPNALNCASVFRMRDLFEETLLHCREQGELLSSVRDDDSLFLWALDCLAHSPTALGLIRKAMDNGWSIQLSDLGTGGFHLDIPEKELTLDHYGLTADSLAKSAFFRDEFLFSFVRGLRDIWQEIRFGAMERDYRPEALLMLERVRAADADTLCVLVAWELRSAGFPDIWRHILGSDIGDLAATYADTIEQHGSSFITKVPLKRVFRQWFFNEARVDRVDHETLNAMDMVLEWAEDQDEFGKPFGERHLDHKVITLISCLPDGKPYLRGIAKEICNGLEFVNIHDAINEAHLFQIVYDMDVVMVDHVPFRDGTLARKIFPDADVERL